MALQKANDDLATVQHQAGAAQQAAEENEEDLNSEPYVALSTKRKSSKKSFAMMATLSEAEERLEEERAAQESAVTEVEQMNAIMADVDSALQEAYEQNAMLIDEVVESKTASSNTCDELLQEKDVDIAELEESCRLETANEGMQPGEPLGCLLQREEVSVHGRQACAID